METMPASSTYKRRCTGEEKPLDFLARINASGKENMKPDAGENSEEVSVDTVDQHEIDDDIVKTPTRPIKSYVSDDDIVKTPTKPIKSNVRGKRRYVELSDSSDDIVRIPTKPIKTYVRGKRRHVELSDSSDDIVKTPTKPVKSYVRGKRRYVVELSYSSDSEIVSDGSSPQQSKGVCSAISPLRKELSDRLFEHCLQNIWQRAPSEKMEHFTFLSCFWFYMYTCQGHKNEVLTWIKNKHIFLKTYAFVPIVMWSHWSLLILCNFNESLQSEANPPCLLLLDSLRKYCHLQLEPTIRRFVYDIFEIEGRPVNKEMIERIPLLTPQVPQQRNNEECGIYALFYISLFLENAPKNFSFNQGYPYFMTKDWFDEGAVEAFYARLEEFHPFPDYH